jgi:hypothetical protein
MIAFSRKDPPVAPRSRVTPRWLTLSFLAILVAACTGDANESQKSGYRPLALSDPLSDPQRSPLGELRKLRQQHGEIWIAPRIVQPADDRRPLTGARLPVATLMQVELVIYPTISCADDNEGHRRLFANGADVADGNPAPIDPSVLTQLGQPLATKRIWIIPAAIQGSEFIGDDPTERIHYSFGPAWFGNFMRVAGHGETTLFPAAQDCREMSESAPIVLNARVFGDYIDPVKISARSPFTARVIERCPATTRRLVEAGVEYQFPLKIYGKPSWTTPRIRDTGEVVGHCASGERKFTYGPVHVAGSPIQAILTSTP